MSTIGEIHTIPPHGYLGTLVQYHVYYCKKKKLYHMPTVFGIFLYQIPSKQWWCMCCVAQGMVVEGFGSLKYPCGETVCISQMVDSYIL